MTAAFVPGVQCTLLSQFCYLIVTFCLGIRKSLINLPGIAMQCYNYICMVNVALVVITIVNIIIDVGITLSSKTNLYNIVAFETVVVILSLHLYTYHHHHLEGHA